MNQTTEDMERMTVYPSGNTVVADMQNCQFSHSRQIALLTAIKLQAGIISGERVRSIKVKLSDGDIRYFRAPANVDACYLQTEILQSPILVSLATMSG